MQRVTFSTRGPLGKSSLREANERVVLLALLRQPGLSRFALAQTTGLSPSAITSIIERLMGQGFLLESKRLETAPPLAGRPRAPLHLRAQARYAIGVEIAATEATAALADLTGNIVAERTVPVDQDATPPQFLRRVQAAIGELVRQGGGDVLGVAVSIPGNLDPATGRVRQATNLAWQDLDAINVLKDGLDLPFYWENNANLAAFAERWFHHGRHLDDFVFVTLRVGIGAGVILNGQLVRGANHCAGEFGHVALVPEGRRCVCGQQGCWEEYASDRALVRRYEERGGHAVDSLAVAARARSGDTAALQALDATAESLALGLCPIILGLNPAAIALDDYGAAAWDLIRERVWQVLDARLPAAWRQGVEIFPSRYATHSSLTGAIALVLAQFFTSFAPEHGGDGGPVRMML